MIFSEWASCVPWSEQNTKPLTLSACEKSAGARGQSKPTFVAFLYLYERRQRKVACRELIDQ